MFFKLIILSIFVISALPEEILEKTTESTTDDTTEETTEETMEEIVTIPLLCDVIYRKKQTEFPKFELNLCAKKLYLTHSEIGKFNNSAFKNLPNLEELDLRRNQLSFENLFSFGSLPKLKKLTLDYQNIWRQYAVSEMFPLRTISVTAFFPSLEQLSLQGLGVFELSTRNWTKLVPKLTTLNLADNKNPLLANLMKNLTNITKLDLSINRIHFMKMVELPNFENVDVSSNKFHSLHITDDPKTCKSDNQLCVGSMKGLKGLKAALCKIETFTIDYSLFDPVPNLTTLNLYFNNLKTLGDPLPSDAMILKLSMLHEMNLRLNHFESIEIFCGLRNLSVLHLEPQYPRSISFNLSDKVEECLPSLKEFYLSGNGMSEIPEHFFGKLHKLEKLYIDKNLSSIPQTVQQ